MLSNVRRKIIQKNIKKCSELRIEDWWNSDTISYIRDHSHLGNQRYSKKKTSETFKKSKLMIHIPYYKVNDEIYNLIPCPSGSFIKGHEEESDNLPQEMKIEKSFLLGETEITQELYCAVMNVKNPSWFQGNRKKPVEQVSWYDALIFCNKLSDMSNLGRHYTITKDGKIIDTIETEQENYLVETNEESKGFRLPTEWEWEYAAKARTQLEYSGSDDPKKIGWYDKNSKDTPHPMKQKNPNAWGFYDMSGNVWEWCENTYDPNNTDISAARVCRGGSWYSYASDLRSAFRGSTSPSARNNNLGFRVARYI
jgi:formylglycine-generating enzyme required for sulfatase activity